MDDAFARRILERAAALEADLQHVGDRQQRLRLHVRGKIAAGDELHGDVAGVFCHHRVEDRNDVRMAQLPGERGFVQQLSAIDRAEFRIAKHLGLDGLQRHLLAGEGVAREIHGAGRTLAEQFLDIVFADLQTEVDAGARFIGHVDLACKLCRDCTRNR